MLFAVQYWCKDCNFRQVHRMLKSVVPSWDSAPENLICPKCRSKDMMKLFSGGSFIISENNNEHESAKPDSYWENAEFVKQKKIRKKMSQDKEKFIYGGGIEKVKQGKATSRMTDQKDL